MSRTFHSLRYHNFRLWFTGNVIASTGTWMQRVAQELPGARVQVCPDAQPLDAQGLPDWSCDGASTGPIRLLAIKLGWPTRHDAEMVRPGTVLLASTGAPP